MKKAIMVFGMLMFFVLPFQGLGYTEETAVPKAVAGEPAVKPEVVQYVQEDVAVLPADDGKETEVVEEDWEALWGPESAAGDQVAGKPAVPSGDAVNAAPVKVEPKKA